MPTPKAQEPIGSGYQGPMHSRTKCLGLDIFSIQSSFTKSNAPPGSWLRGILKKTSHRSRHLACERLAWVGVAVKLGRQCLGGQNPSQAPPNSWHWRPTPGSVSKPMVPFAVGAPPILVYFSGDWDVHWGYGILSHGRLRS